MSPLVSEEVQYKLLALFEQHPDASQREVAAYLGISLGKVNYCLKALAEKGWVKIVRFSKSTNKVAYALRADAEGLGREASGHLPVSQTEDRGV
jgi:EPS-associated MarR family transcriptional regulator